jgi:hypothetical protein
MLRHLVVVRTDVSEERTGSIIGVIRIGELGTILAVTINRSTLRRNTILYCIMLYYTIIFLRSVLRLLVTANVVLSYLILVTPLMYVISSYETPILTKATRHNIPYDGLLQRYAL